MSEARYGGVGFAYHISELRVRGLVPMSVLADEPALLSARDIQYEVFDGDLWCPRWAAAVLNGLIGIEEPGGPTERLLDACLTSEELREAVLAADRLDGPNAVRAMAEACQ